MGLHVYQKGPPIGLGWVIQGWGGSCSGGVGMQGWGGSCRGAVGHAVHVGLITQYQKFTNGYKGMCMSGVMFLKERHVTDEIIE